MRRPLLLLIMLLVGGRLLITPATSAAQRTAEPDSPPVAGLISVSSADANGIVTIEGAAGAVPAVHQVVIRNLYTEQSIYVNAGFNGSFTARMFGPAGTPFWVSSAREIPADLRGRPGSLPGGVGTIVRSAEGALPSRPFTDIVIDADLSDWARYPQAGSGGVFALVNNGSFYVAIRGSELISDFAEARLTLTFTPNAVYTVSLRPDQTNIVTARQTVTNRRDRGSFAANVAVQGVALEARFPTAIIDTSFETAMLAGVALLDANGAELRNITFDRVVLRVNEFDGPAYVGDVLRPDDDAQRFFIAGALAQGSAFWYADGRIDTLAAQPGDTLTVGLDVTLLTAGLPLSVSGLTFEGEIGLQPVSVASQYTNNGWSNVLTPSGLAVDNLSGDVRLGTASAEWPRVVRLADRLLFNLNFALRLPADLPAGLYTPYFRGTYSMPTGERLRWADNGLFGQGSGLSEADMTRLPVVVNVGQTGSTRLPLALLYDHPSDGSRGVLPAEDTGVIALSNRVRYNSPSYVLPPGQYPLEPYLPNILPNAYTLSLTPLVPFLYPSGRLNIQVARPDGATETLGSLPILQNRVSSPELDERVVFGAQSPVDMYRLTTLNSSAGAYDFSAYGDYTITLSATLEDIFGNTYTGGGTYTVTIAEPLYMRPGVLAGTPFEVGDVYYPGAHIIPGYPAEVSVTVRLYPLDGGDTQEARFEGRADQHGHFTPAAGAGFRFDTPGQYVVDYEARHTDQQGRLWAASRRSAGLVATPDGQLLARGARGLARYTPQGNEPRPAWFNTRVYPPSRGSTFIPSLLYTPYHPGDIAFYADSLTSGILPALQVQDLNGAYSDWLHGTLPDFRTASGDTLDTVTRRAALPLLTVLGGVDSTYGPALTPDLIANQAYSYFSAVRPAATTRQAVQGSGEQGWLPLFWDANDPVNRQIGAGLNGDRPGDYTFLFGGLVINNPEAGINTTAIYAALGIVLPEGDSLGPRVYPPYRGQAGGPDGGPLLRVRGVDYETFFVPTGTLPGQVVRVGTPLVIAGQTAPTLHNRLDISVTPPVDDEGNPGTVREISGFTNSIGYFYAPEQPIILDRVGVWTVRVIVTPAGRNSAGVVEPPLPVGGLVGAPAGVFYVYVTDPATAPLAWNRAGDINSSTPAGQPFNFTVNVPAGWRQARAYRTTTIPGYVLDDGTLNLTPGTASYQYNPAGLARDFLNLEASGRGVGPSASDVVTITFAIEGLDAQGTRQVATRTFHILHDRIVSVEDE